MPMPIVDPFEVIDIQHDDRKRAAFGLQQRQLELQAAAVAQAGQRIGLGIAVEPADALLQEVQAEQHGPL
ncbi:hypothetical protein D3C73_1158130 [compost metagenome]